MFEGHDRLGGVQAPIWSQGDLWHPSKCEGHPEADGRALRSASPIPGCPTTVSGRFGRYTPLYWCPDPSLYRGFVPYLHHEPLPGEAAARASALRDNLDDTGPGSPPSIDWLYIFVPPFVFRVPSHVPPLFSASAGESSVSFMIRLREVRSHVPQTRLSSTSFMGCELFQWVGVTTVAEPQRVLVH